MTSAGLTQPKGWIEQTFAPLRNPQFRAIWAAGMASHLGGVIQTIAAAWFMVSLTTSPIMVALVQTAATLPIMLFAPLAGAFADLFDRRIQMVIALSFSAVVSSILVVLAVMELVSPWILLLCTFFIGAGKAFYMPAWQSSVVEIVHRNDLPKAVSLNSLSFNSAQSVGPAIGAEILALAGAAAAFLVNAVSYIGLIAVLAAWKKAPMDRSLPRESLGRAMIDGLRFVGLSPAVRRIMFRGFMFGFGASALMSMPPLIALDLGGGARALGALLGGFGVGAMLGALLAGRLRIAMTANRLSLGASGVIAVMLSVLAASQWLWLSTLAMMIAGGGWMLMLSTLQVAVQTSCPRWVSGRTVSIFMMTFFFGVAGGSASWGVVADFAGVSAALLFSSGLLGIAIILARFASIAEARVSDYELHNSLSQSTMPQVDPRAGPVVVTIDYRVPPANATAFMTAIYALRRLRLRDGARNWSLTQDVDDGELWLERFHSATWADYLHRISRRLTVDDNIYERVLGLCDGPPIRHRRLERPAGSAPLVGGSPPEPSPGTNL